MLENITLLEDTITPANGAVQIDGADLDDAIRTKLMEDLKNNGTAKSRLENALQKKRSSMSREAAKRAG